MRKQHPSDRWRRALPRTLSTRFRHSDRLRGSYLPDASHVQRGIR